MPSFFIHDFVKLQNFEMNEGDTDLTILSFIISNPCSYRASLKKLEDRVIIIFFYEMSTQSTSIEKNSLVQATAVFHQQNAPSAIYHDELPLYC